MICMTWTSHICDCEADISFKLIHSNNQTFISEGLSKNGENVLKNYIACMKCHVTKNFKSATADPRNQKKIISRAAVCKWIYDSCQTVEIRRVCQFTKADSFGTLSHTEQYLVSVCVSEASCNQCWHSCIQSLLWCSNSSHFATENKLNAYISFHPPQNPQVKTLVCHRTEWQYVSANLLKPISYGKD